MKTLVIPDSHEEHIRLQRIIDKYYNSVDVIIHLGDHFDSLKTPCNPYRAVESAKIAKQMLSDPKYTCILGNHDAHYCWGGRFRCSGYSYDKHMAITEILSRDDWAKFKVWTHCDGWVLSHAGFHPKAMVPTTFNPTNTRGKIRAWTTELADSLADSSLLQAAGGHADRFFGAGWARGGEWPVGGIFWLDWNEEFEPIPDVNQIVGHTYKSGVLRQKKTKTSDNWCLDTGLHHVGIIEDGELQIQEV